MTQLACDEDLYGVTLRQLLSLQPTAGPEAPVWLPDGSAVIAKAAGEDGLAIRRIDARTGEERVVAKNLGTLPFLSTSLLAVSPDGRWISYTGDQSPDDRTRSSRVEIWLTPVDGGAPQQLTRINANINSYRWAPDGQSVVFAANRYGCYDIFRVSVPGGETVRLTSGPLYETYPVYSADGSEIYFVRLNEGWTDHEIVVMDANGDQQRVITVDHDLFDYHYGRKFGYPLVSAPTNRLLFPSHRSGWINYWQVPLDGGDPQPLHAESADQSEAVLSPDGNAAAFIANKNGTTRLVVKNLNDGSVRVLVAPEPGVVSAPVWSPDGRTLAYLFGSPTRPADLWVVDVESGEQRQLTASPRAQALADLLISPEKVTYSSFDGLEIAAYLYVPPDAAAHRPCPGLLYIHGGPTSQFMDDYHADVQYFVRKGYVVLMPNIRGSSGFGKAFEDANNGDWGHGDLGDVLAGVELLKTLSCVDGNNMGIHGMSYGGCMSMSAVGFAPGVFKASVPHAGYGDWLEFEQGQELRHRQLMRYEFGDVRAHRQVYEYCSPIYSLAEATTPVFLVHGEGRYPSSDASLKFAQALEQEYKTFEYKVYPNECYYVRSAENLCQMLPDIVDFLDRYLR